MEFVFTLKYKLPPSEQDMDALVDRLYGAGCDDALIGIGCVGRVALEFAREANNAQSAMDSARADVEGVIPGAQLIEAAPDLVGLTDIAKVVSVSRQYMRKLMETHGDFPAPVHEGKQAIWHLADVLEWLQAERGFTLPTGILDVARVAASINLAKEKANFVRNMQHQVAALLRTEQPAKKLAPNAAEHELPRDVVWNWTARSTEISPAFNAIRTMALVHVQYNSTVPAGKQLWGIRDGFEPMVKKASNAVIVINGGGSSGKTRNAL